MKNILHFEIPMDNGQIQLSPEILGRFLQLVHEKIGDEYIVLATPCKPSLLSKDDLLYNFEINNISKDELLKLLQ